MISSSFKEHLSLVLGCKINNVEPVSGGGISVAYCVHSNTVRFFCKFNNLPAAYEMFMAEKAGLEAINQTKTIRVPEVLGAGQFENSAYLLMEFIEAKNPSSLDMENLGHQLANLHSVSISQSFGWEHDNFIGSLAQSNKQHTSWLSFYIEERLKPQLKMAGEQGLIRADEIPSKDLLIKSFQQYFTNIKPSLLHGDLWSGNFLISSEGDPYLIDPAVYIGHHEVDIAMSLLFGGFPSSFYEVYSNRFPVEPFQNERKDIYQLYYLLVHLNLFGSSYYPSVKQILKTYLVS